MMFVLMVALGAALPAVSWADAETDRSAVLSQEQKEDRRLLFNQYVEEEITRREREKYRTRPAQKKQKIWVAKFSALYGYDSNVNANASRRGDGYFQQTLSGSFKVDRPDLPFLPWSGKLGFSGYLDFYNYENFEASSYQTTLLSVFTEEQLTERLQLKLAYELNALRYPDNDQLTYFGHRIRPTLTVFVSKSSSLSFYALHEWRDYRDRKAIDESNLPQEDGRDDRYMEAGINPKYYPDARTYWSATAAVKHNDSNDVFRDYSDYDGWKANTIFYRKLGGPVAAALIGGYDFKQYKSLTFSTFENGPFETQADHLFYGGLYLYVDLRDGWQATGSYLYKQNESNNPRLDWSGYTMSLGLNRSF